MATTGSNWTKWILILILIGAAAGGVWYFIFRGASATQYQTATVTRGDLTQVVTATGQLNPVLTVEVGSQVSGRITKIYVDYNSTIKSNEVIAEIDPSTYNVAVLRAAADLSNAVANLSLNKAQAERAESLFTNKLISASDHDTAIAQLQQSGAQVQSAEANLENANVQLSYCTIYAPVDGVVISRNVDVGQTVASSFSTPTLFLLANDLAKMQIDALVSEADIGEVAVGERVNFSVDAFPYRSFRGNVSQIRYGAITNQNVVNYDCVIEVNNSDLKLLPGMTANVSVVIAERTNALKIPNAALRFRPPEVIASDTNTFSQNSFQGAQQGGRGGGGGSRQGGPGGGGQGRPPGQPRPERQGPRTVYVLDGGEHSKPTPVKIRTGINDGVSTEVAEGLKDGDQVVIGVLLPQTEAAPRPTSPFGGGGGRRF